MRPGSSYRGARKIEAKAAGLLWKALPRTTNYRGDSIFVVTPNSGVTYAARGNRRAKAVYTKPASPEPRRTPSERLYGVAINLPEGRIQMARGGHADLRRAHGLVEDSFPELCGFVTDGGRFVSRREAKAIGVASGQLSGAWREVSRDVLSSDVYWDAK